MAHLSPSFRSGNHLYLSGQLAFDDEGKVGGDIGAQTRRSLSNVHEILRADGLALSDIIKTTVFLTRVEDFAAFDAAYAETFGNHRPARSTVITGLAIPGGLVEIEAIAEVRHAD